MIAIYLIFIYLFILLDSVPLSWVFVVVVFMHTAAAVSLDVMCTARNSKHVNKSCVNENIKAVLLVIVARWGERH